MRNVLVACLALMLMADDRQSTAPQGPYRTLNDRFAAPRFTTLDAWNQRAAYIRAHVLASAGLLPMPEKTPLRPSIFDEIAHADYTVSKVYFESLPGFYVTGNLYRPIGPGPFPAVLSPHGHWAYGRLENTPINSGPGRAISLARQGFVAFTYDMIGYNDSQQIPHTFDGRRERLWGLSLAGLQLWDSIRALDFLETLPYVRRDAIGVTGESGGGTQTFLLASVDPRVAVAAPVNMISLHMQGGCLCENQPGLRLEINNAEIAATIAPRPLLMVSATGDWTGETLEVEYPAVRGAYALFDAVEKLHAVRFTAEHNYNKDSREAMYAWMARWLKQAPADVRVPERSFTVDPLQNLLVFHQRAYPSGAVTAAALSDNWIESAKRQLASGTPASFASAMRHALGFAAEGGAPAGAESPGLRTPGAAAAVKRTVLLAAGDRAVEPSLAAAGFRVVQVPFTPFDSAAAEKVNHFETYNRTAAGQRVADIVAAVRAHPGAALVADGDAALAGLLAAAIVPIPAVVLDIDRFDATSDAAFLERLYIPGLRRAGDLPVAASMSSGEIVVHNAGERFVVRGVRAQSTKLTPGEIVAVLNRAK